MNGEAPISQPQTQRILPAGRHEAAPRRDPRLVLVTGGGGFLGRHIVRLLLARGDRVRVLGRRPYPDLSELGVDCRQADLADAVTVRKAIEGCAAVVHTAALPGVWGDYDVYHRTNYLGTRNVVDGAIAAGVRRLVYTSTPSVVHGGESISGGDESLPYPETFSNPYAATKALAEKLVVNMNSIGFATLAIRPHLIFGPGDTQLIPKLLARARSGRLRRVGDGKNLVSVSYVENVADAHVRALERLEPGAPVAGQVYFVNEPEPVNCWDFINRLVTGVGLQAIEKSVSFGLARTAGRLCELVYRTLGRKDDPPMTRFLAEQLATDHWFRIDKATRDLDWRPAVGLDEGVGRTLEFLTNAGYGTARKEG